MNSTGPTSSTFSFGFQVPNIGNGFVEIAMLTTLVGPAAAETLVLGNRGAAGLAWATMSAFGAGRVIRACLSGACAPWLREFLGLRSNVTDSSFGMELSSLANGKFMNTGIRSRYAAEGPLALLVDSRESSKESEAQHGGKLVWNEIYAFDDSTSRLIKSIPEDSSWSSLSSPSSQTYKEHSVDTKTLSSSSSSSIPTRSNTSFSTRSLTSTISGTEDIILFVYRYPPYQYYSQHHVKFQLSMLGLSLFKVGESFALWRFSASPLLSLVTALPWLYFFIVAVIVEVNDLSKTRILQDPDSHVDMLSGQLPRMTHGGAGGTRKIILGAPQNTRNATRWKIMWGIGALVCLLNIIFTYIALSHESNNILSIWIFFQILWAFVRIIVHHFTEQMTNSDERVMDAWSWSALPSSLKYRIVKLMSALAGYLTSVHPRQEIAYRTSAVSPEELKTIILNSSPSSCYPLPKNIVPSSPPVAKKIYIEIEIKAVIGDPVLSSAGWIAGARNLTTTDMYDSCIISFRICIAKLDDMPQEITIPCARVLSGVQIFSKTFPKIDEEVIHHSRFVPKHTVNDGGNWCYFIPACEPGLWLYFKKDVSEEIVGKHVAETLTDSQVTDMLACGGMNISLTHVDDIKQVVVLSDQARQILLQMLVH